MAAAAAAHARVLAGNGRRGDGAWYKRAGMLLCSTGAVWWALAQLKLLGP